VNESVLHEEFAAQAARTPNAVALRHAGSSITFAELNERAERLASFLRCAGVRDAFVGVHAERSIEYVVSTLGVLKAGCAVVPLPPSYPAQRLRQILDVAALAAVVDADATPFDASLGVRVIHLSDASASAPEPAAPTENACERAAYVLSSSGSTGRPKMIVRSHRSFFHRLRWTWERHPYKTGEVCVQKSHMTTTHAIYELFEPMLRGVAVHIVSDDEVRDLGEFWNGLTDRGVSRLLIVPSLLQASLEIPGLRLPPLELLVLMGERVSPALAARAIDVFPEATAIVSIYGSTEASSALVCDVRASYRFGRELPLGAPISTDVRAVALDDSLAPVRDGAIGMLYLGGPQLFTEYYDDPSLTASVRVERGGEVLYRSEDHVRLLPGGELEFVGRADDTVKVRGSRVDLREVEGTIAQQRGVTACVALVAGGNEGAGSPSLVAFVTPKNADSREILRSVRQTLPSHMVPSAMVTLDAFPLTPSGKVDRRRLLEDFLVAPVEASAVFATDTERTIADVWGVVVGHRRFDRTSSFFEIGGTSLDAFVVEHSLGEAFSLDGAALRSGTLYRYPTLAELASYVDRVRAGGAQGEPSGDTILVTLKRGADPALPPLYLISSAGGTLGAYSKLVGALGKARDVVGVRDPFLWDARDPAGGFQAWVTQYVDAIRERQPSGPYYVVAYSSAGAFGYEIARRLRSDGNEVALLALIDPLALDRGSNRRFGYWALEARFGRPMMAHALRVAGQLRRVMPRPRANGNGSADWKLSRDEFERFANDAKNDRGHLRRVSALLELNTGLPFGLSESDMAAANGGGGPAEDVLLNRIRRVAPETDIEMMRRLLVQYELQVRSHHKYELRPYDGDVCLFEPDGPHAGLESAQLRPYVRRLHARRLALGAGGGSTSALDGAFPRAILAHYLCMRDDTFVAQLARELDALTSA
jgi:enterobactin synthetase component F